MQLSLSLQKYGCGELKQFLASQQAVTERLFNPRHHARDAFSVAVASMLRYIYSVSKSSLRLTIRLRVELLMYRL
jgi:hypothetical protein